VLVSLCFVVFWGTFFPLISEAITGQEASVGPPWFNRYVMPLALALVLLSGIGPLIAWRRATAANLRRTFAFPVGAALAVLVVLVAAGVTGSIPALLMFCFAAFVLGTLGQELWRGVRARRAMSGESVPLATVALVRRNRPRWGGYLVHAGMAVLFVGVAASSAFQQAQLVELRPGQEADVAGYAVRYERPTSRLVAAPNGRLERIDLGAELQVRRGDATYPLSTYKSYFPSTDPSLGPVSRFFEGEATTEVGLKAGLRRDLWTAVAPDIRGLKPRIDEGDRVFAAARDLPDEQRAAFLAEALSGLTRSYAKDPPPATFRIIASPMVTWIWLGALLVFFGGLTALWPAGAAARRPATAAGLARVARELGRA